MCSCSTIPIPELRINNYTWDPANPTKLDVISSNDYASKVRAVTIFTNRFYFRYSFPHDRTHFQNRADHLKLIENLNSLPLLDELTLAYKARTANNRLERMCFCNICAICTLRKKFCFPDFGESPWAMGSINQQACDSWWTQNTEVAKHSWHEFQTPTFGWPIYTGFENAFRRDRNQHAKKSNDYQLECYWYTFPNHILEAAGSQVVSRHRKHDRSHFRLRKDMVGQLIWGLRLEHLELSNYHDSEILSSEIVWLIVHSSTFYGSIAIHFEEWLSLILRFDMTLHLRPPLGQECLSYLKHWCHFWRRWT